MSARRDGVLWGAFALAVASCSTADRAPSTTVTITPRSTLETLRGFPAFADHLGAHVSLRPTAEGLRIAPTSSWQPAHRSLEVALPRSADGVLRLGIVGRAGISLEVVAVDAHELDERRTETIEGAIVHHDVAPGVDLIHVVEPDRVEELRLLRDRSAPRVARWNVRKGPGIQAILRSSDGGLAAIDRGGATVFIAAPMFAVDARNVRRALEVTVEDGEREALVVATLDDSGLEYPIVIDPLWTATGAGVTGGFSVTGAISGTKVLLFGGNSGGATSAAEVYDATTNSWRATPNLPKPNTQASASTMVDGKILIAGGTDQAGAIYSSALIYDPTGNTLTPTTSMKVPRDMHAAARLSGGKIGVFGGSGTSYTEMSTAEAYDTASKTWKDLAPMPFARWGHTATTLLSNKVLVVGGFSASFGSECALYDPSTNTWRAAHALNKARYDHAAVLLASGKVLVAGGFAGSTPLPNGEIYDPDADTWTVTGLQKLARSYPTMAPLASGRALLTGDDATAEIYDPLTNSWSATASMRQARQGAVAFVLPGDQVLVAGGSNASGALFDGEIYSQYDLGAACTTATDCRSGFCTEGVCCGAASCGAGKTCAFAGKAGSCVSVTGAACGASTECGSGFCVDGVCCGSACTDQCAACDVIGKLGVCAPASGAPHASHAACTGTGAGTPCGPTCNGSDATKCNYLAAGATSCGADACTAGKETHVGTCDGAGKCNDAAKTCGAYACGAKTCDTTCSTIAECAPGFFCKGTACAPVVGLGEACVDASTCGSGLFCTDGVCCGVASCGAGKSCALGAPGTCTSKNGIACGLDSECGSGHCVDGVCCATACTGQCEACDVAGSPGACSPVSGAPHGSRPKCDDGGGDVCKALSCDGAKDATKCTTFANGGKTTCKPASCGGSSFTGPSSCDGAGACVAPSTSSCVPYACSSDGCKTSCSDSSPCAVGYSCKAGTCVAVGATCSGDGLTSISKDGASTPCAPYRCVDPPGTCQTTCETSDQCVPGSACDLASKACVLAASNGDSGSSGGCNLGRPFASGDLLAWLFGLLVAATARRRRV